MYLVFLLSLLASLISMSSGDSVAPPVTTSVPVLLSSVQAAAPNTLPPPGLTVQSGTVTNVSPLLVKTEGITAVPALGSGLSTSPSPSQNMPTIPHTVEINPEALEPPLPVFPSPLATVSSTSSTMTTTSLALEGSVTGTGSVTATPTAYTTAVMTTATTTTSTLIGQSSGGMLGKRVRRQSSKYEDYEQQTAIVCDNDSTCACDVYSSVPRSPALLLFWTLQSSQRRR